jgi:hypothetical protein
MLRLHVSRRKPSGREQAGHSLATTRPSYDAVEVAPGVWQGPVVSLLGRQWTNGEITGDEYFDEVWRRARATCRPFGKRIS